MFPTLQAAILAATQPDAIVLVVNTYDTDEYIIRTLHFAESITGSNIICIALSFRNVKSSFSPLEQNVIPLTEKEINEHKNRISKITGKVCFSINQVDDIFDVIIKYLNEEA